MRNRLFFLLTASFIMLAMAVVLTGCSQKITDSGTTKATDDGTGSVTTEAPDTVSTEASKPVDKDDLPVITLYPGNANMFSGPVTGHRSDYFAENGFQMEVWAYSDEKTTGMLTTGELPDLLTIGKGGVELLETLIDTGKIINFEDYKEYLPNWFENPYSEYVDNNWDVIREKFSSGTGGLYVLPWTLGPKNGIYAQVAAFDRNVVKLKWDVYEAIGAPKITDFYQLLDVAEEMLKYQPTAEDGTKMFGSFLDNGMDSDRFGGMYLWYRWHGYNDTLYKYFTEVDVVNGTVKSIFDEDSLYKEGVKWYNEMYNRGLMDPDSISTARTDQAPKIDGGYAMLPAGTLPGWQTKYYEVFVPGLNVYIDHQSEAMTSVSGCIVVNAETEHLEECLAFINSLADPYALLRMMYGPEGDIWEADGSTLSITDEFAAWVEKNGNINKFPMSDGTEWSTWQISYAAQTGVPIPGYTDVNGDPVSYMPTSWPDTQVIMNANDNWSAWQKTMGATDLWDYVEKNNITVHQTSPFDGVTVPKPDDSLSLTISAIKDIVVPATWNMIYAESEKEMEEIWDNMVKDAMTLGAQGVIDWFTENYKPAK